MASIDHGSAKEKKNNRKVRKRNLLRVSLCDSRTCHQQGGGEHLKTDIEDLVQLVANTQSKVQLTSCLGLCNRSPNIMLQSRGDDVLLYTPTTKKRFLEQQGNVIPRRKNKNHNLQKEDSQEATSSPQAEGEEIKQYYVTSHKVIVSGINAIPKVAYALGIWEQPKLVRAMELRANGNKARRKGNYQEALRHYAKTKSELCGGGGLHAKGEENSPSEILSSLAASIWLSCIQCRVQWATTALTATSNSNHHQLQHNLLSPLHATTSLQVAARDALQILAHNDESNVTTNNVISILLKVQSTLEDLDNNNNGNNNNHHTTTTTTNGSSSATTTKDTVALAVPVITDGGTLAHICVALANAWSALAELEENEAESLVLQKAARKAYTSILTATQLTPKIFRLRERLRIERSVLALQTQQQQSADSVKK